ncbi:MAG: ATP-binding protein [Candidatus Dadabacteria bacterium]|nr:ATP-binding protein [Candidatus Dadabacteria bacterium]
MTKNSVTITIKNELPAIKIVIKKFKDFMRRHHKAAPIINKMNIVIDEILNNIISYAFSDKEEHYIDIEFSLIEDKLKIAFIDDGIPFNQLDVPSPDITLSLEKRGIGGNGIHIVRETMDEANYQRNIDKNIITFTKRVISKDLKQ